MEEKLFVVLGATVAFIAAFALLIGPVFDLFATTPIGKSMTPERGIGQSTFDWWHWLSDPSPDDMIEAFRDNGLEVGATYPVGREPAGALPKTYSEAVRFEIPSMGKDEQGQGQGGRVFAFDSARDLEVVENHYKSAEQMPVFGSRLRSHLYRNGLILVQINGGSPPDIQNILT